MCGAIFTSLLTTFLVMRRVIFPNHYMLLYSSQILMWYASNKTKLNVTTRY
ncbi:hypothetical protein ZEAMMB73_Zm00001d018746 [Zea mays]|uniref:Uncharacterized protein n=1 Tax=Zea mays TaxID=4577 RepID=A0A1D6HRW8_MAIZE|nr:hypothetical protein ZEAMMB73_Zm00001d018746 [Zea mays]